MRKSEGKEFWRYVWDHENRLAEAGTRKQKVRYKYDALGRHVQRYLVGNKENTKFTYDGLDVVMDDDNGTITKYQNGPGIDNKLSLKTGSDVKYFLTDHLGSTNGLADSTGAIVSSASYDSFGNQTGTLATRYGFTGRENDSFTGLMHYRARQYDPKLGRFISEDPIGFVGGDVNLFGYVGNNPLRFRDPLGLSRCNPIVGALIGGFAGLNIGGAAGVIGGAFAGGAIGGATGAGLGTLALPGGGTIVGGGAGAVSGATSGGIAGGVIGGAAGAGIGAYIGYNYCNQPPTTACETKPRAIPLDRAPARPRPTPNRDDGRGTCDRLLFLCLNNPWQPNPNSPYGPRKDCGACYRECKADGGAWPFYKCPIS